MKHIFKKQALKELIRYNQWLLTSCVLLSVAMLCLSLHACSSHEQWVLIPANNPDKRMHISSKGYSETYLQEWAYYVMQTLMTTSYDTVVAQIAELKVISSNSDALNSFFKKHQSFVTGSNIQSVFFPKSVELEDKAVLVSGLFRYWLGSSEKVISQERTYRLTYKRGPRDILLLKDIRSVVHEKIL